MLSICIFSLIGLLKFSWMITLNIYYKGYFIEIFEIFNTNIRTPFMLIFYAKKWKIKLIFIFVIKI